MCTDISSKREPGGRVARTKDVHPGYEPVYFLPISIHLPPVVINGAQKVSGNDFNPMCVISKRLNK